MIDRVEFRAALLCALWASGAETQEATNRPAGKAVGVSIVGFAVEGEMVHTPAVALHYTRLREKRVALDFSLATVPERLMAGVLALAPDLGAAYAVFAGPATFLAKAGGSAGLAVGRDGGIAMPGLHAGGAALFRVGERVGLRFDVVPRLYWFEGEAVTVVTVGMGLTSLPRSGP